MIKTRQQFLHKMTNKKNFSALSKIDRYADVVSLTLNGKKFHGTRLGGCLTIMLFLTVFAYWVNGTLDCFNKTTQP